MKQFTDEYKKKGYPLHVLLNNAAIQSPKGKRGAKTEEGFEVLSTKQSSFRVCQGCARVCQGCETKILSHTFLPTLLFDTIHYA